MSTASLYDRVVKHIFYSGNVSPGSKIVEKRLAEQLGVSRIPIRETLGRLAGQGLLVSEHGSQGVRVRRYTAEELRQLYELRELLEGGAARAAAKHATETDLARLDTICKQTETEVGNYGSKQWANLDHAFHDALAEAGHNERIAQSLKLLLTECHYVFYLLPYWARPKPSQAEAASRMRRVLKEHRALIGLIRAGDADGAEDRARKVMRASSKRMTQALIEMDLHR